MNSKIKLGGKVSVSKLFEIISMLIFELINVNLINSLKTLSFLKK